MNGAVLAANFTPNTYNTDYDYYDNDHSIWNAAQAQMLLLNETPGNPNNDDYFLSRALLLASSSSSTPPPPIPSPAAAAAATVVASVGRIVRSGARMNFHFY